ncbi:hypothetical protein AAER22_08190 [Pseudomonas aeruginosa]|uniref:hypothetical protein n=1 Tax=Pseudomonas TaxID=286 RepID=UPI000689BE6E|nr:MULTISPECIES: hypothetical protein [Pseudomonas]KAA5656607.1 hypothetical protein F3G58_24865 [Pseudomonas aeruginosa]MBM2717514.1 hypothetical protein [Pseudomonas aeruginosa]MBY9839244.1 hypothetical protein [Pseudomonas aeruginosa]MCF8576957.1 hypothetical protein [Pseudomonas aeruginosa]MCG7142622.1 hypothetical protein [Pseudomonas aeruginosa]
MTAKRFVRCSIEQYRYFAEIARQARTCLELVASSEIDGNFGRMSLMCGDAFVDASSDKPGMMERCIIELVVDIDVDRFRSCARPEIDWSTLADDEIHLFVLQHEIGHRVDNFHTWDMSPEANDEVRARCNRYLRWANEVLADRYAWSKVRPGEPMPIGEHGVRNADLIEETLAFLDTHIPRMPCKPQQTDPNCYSCVPVRMLSSDVLAAYVGPECHPAKIARAREYVRSSRERRHLPYPVPLFEAGPGDIVLTSFAGRAAA